MIRGTTLPYFPTWSPVPSGHCIFTTGQGKLGLGVMAK